jgi:caffeoyl-CoA O-methyltransferase
MNEPHVTAPADTKNKAQKDKAHKKWWEVKREKKKRRREELNKEIESKNGVQQAVDSDTPTKQKAVISAATEGHQSEARGRSPPETAEVSAATDVDAGNGEPKKKKRKKSKNKAMSKHAATHTPHSGLSSSSSSSSAKDGPSSELSSSASSTSAKDEDDIRAVGGGMVPSAPSALESYAERHSDAEPELLKSLRAATRKALPQADHMTSGPLQGRLLKALVGIKQAKKILEIGTFCGYSALCMAEGLAGCVPVTAPRGGCGTPGMGTAGERSSILTLEIDPEAAAVARKYFAQSSAIYPLGPVTVELVVGPAMDTLSQLAWGHKAAKVINRGPFDLVFLDADKKNYRAYYDLLLDPTSNLLAPGALLLCDNVLFKGLVLNSKDDEGCEPANNSRNNKKKKPTEKKLNYWKQRHQDIADSLHCFNAYVAQDKRTEAVLVPLRDGLTVIRKI